MLDSALLRPGRISRRIVVPLPDEAGRRAILATHMAKKPMESEEYKRKCTEYLAAVTYNFSGAELENVVNEGALLAARRSGDLVTLTDYLSGVERTRHGVNAPNRLGLLGGIVDKVGQMFMSRNRQPARASPLF